MPLGTKEEQELFRHLRNTLNELDYATTSSVARAAKVTVSDVSFLFEKMRNQDVIQECGTVGCSKKYRRGGNFDLFEKVHEQIMAALEEWGRVL